MQQIGSMFFVQVALLHKRGHISNIYLICIRTMTCLFTLIRVVNMVREHVKGVGENFTQWKLSLGYTWVSYCVIVSHVCMFARLWRVLLRVCRVSYIVIIKSDRHQKAIVKLLLEYFIRERKNSYLLQCCSLLCPLAVRQTILYLFSSRIRARESLVTKNVTFAPLINPLILEMALYVNAKMEIFSLDFRFFLSWTFLLTLFKLVTCHKSTISLLNALQGKIYYSTTSFPHFTSYSLSLAN